jgi:hypothetical protein
MAKWDDINPRDTSPAWARLVREARRRDSTPEATLAAALNALATAEPRATTGVGAPPPEDRHEGRRLTALERWRQTLDDEWRWREMSSARSAEQSAYDLRKQGYDATSRGKRVYARKRQPEPVERLPVLHVDEVAAIGRILAEPPRPPAPALVEAVRRYRDESDEDE